jgi:dynein heavy chain
VKKKSSESREIVRPVFEKEIQKLKVNVTNFHDKMKDERKKFEAKNIFKYETGSEAAYKSIISTRTELLGFEKDSKLFAENARIFDQGDIMKPSWRSTLWKDINTDEMEEVTKNFIKFFKSMDKSIRTNDAYINLDAESKKFMSSIPVIADLKHPSMRDRHWDAVKKVTKSSFTVDATFKLSSLIDIGLFNFEEDISEIVNGAQKEQRMEVALKKISTVWTSVEFEFTKHKDTDLHLIRLKEEDFDTLEDHQVQIQDMMSSKHVAVFEKKVVEWQGKLSKVSDVYGIMSEIQRTWAYLETLFIGSEEVEKELPEDTVPFAQVNVTMEKSLRSLFAAKKAVDGANAPGLYDDMEQMQDKLTKCEKSLAN